MDNTAIKDLHDYFAKEMAEDKFEFRIVPRQRDSGIEFYIHPLGKDGDTADFSIIKYTEDDFQLAMNSKT